MVQIYPERLSESVLRDPKRAAERRLYQALSDLDGQFVVFYSVAWQARGRGTTVEDGEADFVIAHSDLGILVMEVKGGGIAYNAQNGQWSSTDRNGVVNSIDDPVDQARRSRYTLFEKLRDMPGWDRKRWLTIGQVVVFPDVHIGDASLRLDLPREIVFDNSDVHDIVNAVHRGFEYYASKDGRMGDLCRIVQRVLVCLLGLSRATIEGMQLLWSSRGRCRLMMRFSRYCG